MPAAPGGDDSWDHYLDYWAGERPPEPKTVDEAWSHVSSDWRRLFDDDNLIRVLGPLAPALPM
ncbi:hypothetical protein [Burkholderia pseudomallei]|uniref:hypothetical protein n=1 Tax=Burkholderia pseudomallei TaxID=28450 RepID=UPI00053794EA|nr:hypothetical protein [Burkholderia pseudomallei]KGW85305.1 hypothetical protein Y030_2320 [Burkholderia pseudomallei MSHR332]